MKTPTNEPPPAWRLLATARALTAPERAWVERLANALELPHLEEHVASAQVIAACGCGCPSVLLSSRGPELSADIIKALNRGDRDDDVSSEGSFRNQRGQEVEVTLHISSEALLELEVWAGHHGGEVATELPLPD